MKGKKKAGDMFKLSREGKPNPIPKNQKIVCLKVDRFFAEEKLQRVPWAKNFATLKQPSKNNCMICRLNVSMRARGVYEVKRHNQSPNQLRQDQRLREKF